MSTPKDDAKPTFPYSAHRQQLIAQATFGEQMAKAIRDADQRATTIMPMLSSQHWEVAQNLATAASLPLTQYLTACYSNYGPTAQRLREEARLNTLISQHVEQRLDSRFYRNFHNRAEEAIAILSPQRFPHASEETIEAILAPYFPFLTRTGFNVFTPTDLLCNDSGDTSDTVSSTALTPRSKSAMGMGVWTMIGQKDNPLQRYLRWRLHICQIQEGGSVVMVGLYGHSSSNFGFTPVHLYNHLENDYFEIPVNTYTYGDQSTPRPSYSPLDYFDFDRLKSQLKDFMEHQEWSEKAYDAKCWTEEGLKEQIHGLTSECPVYDFEPLRAHYEGKWGFSKEQPCPTVLTMGEYNADAYSSQGYMEWVDHSTLRVNGLGEEELSVSGMFRLFRCKLPWKDRSGHAIRVEGCFDTGEIRLLNADDSVLTLFPRARAGVFFKIKQLRKNYLLHGLRRWLLEEKHPVPDYLAVPEKRIPLEPSPEDANKDVLSYRLKTDEELKAEWQLLPLSSLYVDPSEEESWA